MDVSYYVLGDPKTVPVNLLYRRLTIGESIGTGPAITNICARAPVDSVIPASTQDTVVAIPTVDPVGKRAAQDQIIGVRTIAGSSRGWTDHDIGQVER